MSIVVLRCWYEREKAWDSLKVDITLDFGDIKNFAATRRLIADAPFREVDVRPIVRTETEECQLTALRRITEDPTNTAARCMSQGTRIHTLKIVDVLAHIRDTRRGHDSILANMSHGQKEALETLHSPPMGVGLVQGHRDVQQCC